MTTHSKQNIIGLKEFRQNADFYIGKVNKGESFTVLKRSTPVFKIVPFEQEEIWESVADFTTINKNGIPIGDFIKALEKRAHE